MRTAGPEWGNHKAELFSCRGVFKGVGLPYVYFHRPSYTLMELFPDVAGEAGFQPQGFQLLRCDECSEFEYGLYSPSLNRVAFTTTKPNLPILRDWNWAWETVPSEVRDRYERARDLWLERPRGALEESLHACRVCLETIVRSIANIAAVSLPGSNLFTNIDFLHSHALLESRLRKIAHEIRQLANPAAHGGEPLLDRQFTRNGKFVFETDGTITLICLEALIAHVFLHPFLRIAHSSEAAWCTFFEWLDSAPVGPTRPYKDHSIQG